MSQLIRKKWTSEVGYKSIECWDGAHENTAGGTVLGWTQRE